MSRKVNGYEAEYAAFINLFLKQVNFICNMYNKLYLFLGYWIDYTKNTNWSCI